MSGERGQLYLKRQQLFELGPVVVEFITEVVHIRPRTWKGDVEKLHEILLGRGAAPLLAAVQKAAAKHLFGAEYVSDLLKETA